MMQVEKDRVVAFRYIMKNSRDEMLENTMEGIPTIYLHGADAIQQLLQNQLLGLTTGGRKTLQLSKSSGLVNDDFTFEVIIDEVRDALPEELMLGYPLQVSAVKCETDCDCYA